MMKPIEIHIEGYKIVISEDGHVTEKPHTVPIENHKDDYIIHKDDHVIKTYPTWPPESPDGQWWNKPYVTWSNEDNLKIVPTTTNTTTTNPVGTPVRDAMTGTTTCTGDTCEIDFSKFKSDGNLVGGDK